jgi:hypothetical protein
VVRYGLGYLLGMLALLLLIINTSYVVQQAELGTEALSVINAAADILMVAPVLVPVWLVSNYLLAVTTPIVANVVEGGMTAAMGSVLLHKSASAASTGAELLLMMGWGLVVTGAMLAVVFPLAYQYRDRLAAAFNEVIGP